jgi:hypothetical protein
LWGFSVRFPHNKNKKSASFRVREESIRVLYEERNLQKRKRGGTMGREAREAFAREAEALIERVGNSLGYDYTGTPVFPEGRDDIAVVRRTTENGVSYGYDTIYVVWKEKEKEGVCHDTLADTRASKDYLHIRRVFMEEDMLVVVVASSGSFSGKAWERTIRFPLPR